jgi:hypothetical protein
MNRRFDRAAWALLVTMVFAPTGCRRGTDTAHLTELQRVKSGTIDVVLLSPSDALHHGKDSFTIEFRSTSDGRLVDVGDVRGSATMPMSGMPMFGAIDVKRTEVPGRYSADGQFDMAGTWRMTIQWQGPAEQGAVTFAGTVQ